MARGDVTEAVARVRSAARTWEAVAVDVHVQLAEPLAAQKLRLPRHVVFRVEVLRHAADEQAERGRSPADAVVGLRVVEQLVPAANKPADELGGALRFDALEGADVLGPFLLVARAITRAQVAARARLRRRGGTVLGALLELRDARARGLQLSGEPVELLLRARWRLRGEVQSEQRPDGDEANRLSQAYKERPTLGRNLTGQRLAGVEIGPT